MQAWNDNATTKPAKAGRYLVAGFDGIKMRIVIMRWNDINNRWVQTGVLAHITVTHWMPLPAPPDDHYCAYGEREENGSNDPDEYPVCFNMI